MIPSAANALIELFNHSKDSLSYEQLEWYSELDQVSICESNNMVSVLNALGALFTYTSNDNKEALPDNERLGAIFYSLSAQAEMIDALMQVSNKAAYLLDKKVPDIKEPV